MMLMKVISAVLIIVFIVIVYQMYTSTMQEKKEKVFTENDFIEPHHSTTLSQATMPTESNISYEIDNCNAQDTNHHGNCTKCEPINLENEKRQQIQELSSKEKPE